MPVQGRPSFRSTSQCLRYNYITFFLVCTYDFGHFLSEFGYFAKDSGEVRAEFAEGEGGCLPLETVAVGLCSPLDLLRLRPVQDTRVILALGAQAA